jgi:hypothetical protein
VLVLIQAVVSHKQVVAATAIFYSSISVGGVIGDAISGSMYRQQYPKRLADYAPFLSEKDIDTMVNNVNAPLKYAWGSEERTAIIAAFNNVYRHLLYGPVIVGGALILFAVTLPNVDLSQMEERVKGVVFGNTNKKETERNDDENQDLGSEKSCQKDNVVETKV